MEPSVGLLTMVAGVTKDLSSSDVLTAGKSKCMKSSASVPTALIVKSTLQRKYMSALELWDSSRLITLLKMGVESSFLAKFPSMEVSNFWVSPIYVELVDPCLLIISWL